jgi:hypothetical protein
MASFGKGAAMAMHQWTAFVWGGALKNELIHQGSTKHEQRSRVRSSTIFIKIFL